MVNDRRNNMLFQLKHYALPHDGIIPGARGHKKQIIPAGTKVWCIVYGTLMYRAVYQDEQHALKVMQELQNTAEGKARRTMLEWNFSSRFPKRVVREHWED
jgi:hypothetical protein